MALSYSEIKRIASRYGEAWFSLARDQHALDAAAQDARFLQALTADAATWKQLAANPLLAPEAKLNAVRAALHGHALASLTESFLQKLAQHNRLAQLAEIVRNFQARLSAERGETIAEVITASPLDEGARGRIAEQLRQTSGKEVAVSFKEDAALLGGMIIRAGSKLLDYSVRGRLAAMREALTKQLNSLPS